MHRSLLLCGLLLVASRGDGATPTMVDDTAGGAARAEAQLRATHFFVDGRGLIALPQRVSLLRQVTDASIDLLRHRTGVIVDARVPVGYFWAEWRGTQVLAAGCAACHVGRAAGRTIVGLGNKSVDVGELGLVVAGSSRVAAAWSNDAAHRELVDRALRFGQALSDPRWTNQTRGLVPTSLVFRWFYDRAGLPFPDDFPRGSTKVPHLWGYDEKQHVGGFVDGFADGDSLGWTGLVELASGQSYDGFQTYRDRLAALKRSFAHLQPPAYPFAIEVAQAARGRDVFARICAECHGEYRRDAGGRAIFQPPEFVPLATVGTDDDRLKYRSPEFLRLVDDVRSDDFRYHDRAAGYFAPRLDGVWARFPYLHNGSVPSLQALLTPPPARPHYWSLVETGEAHRFDPVAVGLTLPTTDGAEDRLLRRRAAAGSRDVYWIERRGHSNRGHDFGTDLPADEKRDLIEYLKTL